MSKATIMDAITNVRTGQYTHSAATEPGDVVVGNGSVLVAINKKDANVENAYIWEGKTEFDKEASLAINFMDAVYWDNTAGKVTKTVTGNTPCGHCVEKALAADATVVVYLRPYVKT